MGFRTWFLAAAATSLIAGCGGSGGSSGGGTNFQCEGSYPPLVANEPETFSYSTLEATTTVTAADQCGTQIAGLVNLSGTATYDFIPISSSGLDYASTSAEAVKGATVEIRYESGGLYGRTTTDENGMYSINVPQNQSLRVWVLAELRDEGTASYEIQVTNNTSGNALYVLSGTAACTGTSDSARDLHADSGWDGSDYSGTRVAAPFAILDSIYQALTMIVSAEPSVQLPPVELRWSIDNIAVSGDRSQGEIGTSSYTNGLVYILGHKDNDTDEYDRSVVQHEFTHYLEDMLSRSDSVGGSHSLTGQHDMRVAYGEGLANAFAGIFSGTDLYRDSGGPSQGQTGIEFSLEDNVFTTQGWYNENSVGKIVFDVFDDDSEVGDDINAGFTPIFQAMLDAEYELSESKTSIYLFANTLSALLGTSDANSLEQLLTDENIIGRGIFADGETNQGLTPISLPPYTDINPNSTENICSNQSGGTYNGIGVRRFLKLDIAQDGCYQIEATRTSSAGDKNTDPDIVVSYGGSTITTFESSTPNLERGTQLLRAGTYVIEFYDYDNVTSEVQGGLSCFDLNVTQGET